MPSLPTNVQSMRITSLAQVPPMWGQFMLQRIPDKSSSKTNKPAESSSGTKVNAEADTSLIERFKNSRFDKVSSMGGPGPQVLHSQAQWQGSLPHLGTQRPLQ